MTPAELTERGVRVKPSCPECNDTGQRDTGGVYPWGESIFVPCDCDAEARICAALTTGGNDD